MRRQQGLHVSTASHLRARWLKSLTQFSPQVISPVLAVLRDSLAYLSEIEVIETRYCCYTRMMNRIPLAASLIPTLLG
jgi:hypothetical protein